MRFSRTKEPSFRPSRPSGLNTRRLLPSLLSTPNGLERNTGDKGFLQLLERGQLPPGYDLELPLTSDGPMRAIRAPMYHPHKRNQQRKIMTEKSIFCVIKEYRLDYDEIVKLPPTLDVGGLKAWEVEQRDKALATEVFASTDKTSGITTPVSSNTAARDDLRTYTELLDLYSMHEFIIRKGKTLRRTPEFASFKRHYMASWDVIEAMIKGLEGFLTLYGVEIAYIDGKKLAALAAYQLGDSIFLTELLECIANAEEVIPLLKNSAQQYRLARDGDHLAATKIQSIWRMHHQRIAYKHLQLGNCAATVIQRQWAIHRAHCVTRRAIHAAREARTARWKQTMEMFRAKWPQIRLSRRVVIHLPSLSFPAFHARHVPFYSAQQMGLLSRLFDLADPNVHVILVVPFKPEEEIIAYYNSLLEEAGVPDATGRLTLVVPEDAKRLPERMSLTRLTLLSPRLMKLLKALCTGKPAYIVPGVLGLEELTLASQLNIPLFSPEPRVAHVFGTKSGCKRLLEAADVARPPGCVALRSRSALLSALANLMVERRDVSRWLIKLDTECSSRGHAYLDTSRMKSLKESPETNSVALADSVRRELEEFGARRVRLVHPYCYHDWHAYLSMVDNVGACIEAVPNRIITNVAVNFFIEPSGEIHLQSVVESLLAPAFTVTGSCFPCSSGRLPYAAVESTAARVAAAAYRKRIFGYMSVDFVVFEGQEGGKEGTNVEEALTIWAVDVDLYLTNNAAAYRVAAMFATPQHSPLSPMQESEDNGVDGLKYIYSGLIYNPSIASIRHAPFFSLCRAKGISYDREERSGMVFHLVDVLLRGCVGALSLGKTMSHAIRKMALFQSLLNLELPKQGEHHLAESNFVYFSSILRQLSRLERG